MNGLQPAQENGESFDVACKIGSATLFLRLNTGRPTQRFILEHLERGQWYEQASTAAILDALNPGDTFFDVGANCGWFSAVALTGGAKVLAFEPHPENVAALRINASGATIIEAAVAEHRGTINLFVNEDNDGGHALWPCGIHPFNVKTKAAEYPFARVPSVRLDDYAEVRPTVLKIDTEGAEWGVLMGAQAILAQPQLRLVVCERNDYGLQLMGHVAADIEEIMVWCGFVADAMPAGEVIENWIFRKPL